MKTTILAVAALAATACGRHTYGYDVTALNSDPSGLNGDTSTPVGFTLDGSGVHCFAPTSSGTWGEGDTSTPEKVCVWDCVSFGGADAQLVQLIFKGTPGTWANGDGTCAGNTWTLNRIEVGDGWCGAGGFTYHDSTSCGGPDAGSKQPD